MPAIVRTCYAVLLAAGLIVIGLIWDISWHRSIGRDTFWTPPHVVEYVAAIIVGVSCGWLILRATFAKGSPDRGSMVRFWGFHGPLGAWVSVWGSLAMLTSAPFDDWWHSAYGLDVQIISPPHILLLLGMMGIVAGAMLMTLAEQNRAGDSNRRDFAMMFGLASAFLLLMLVTATFEYTAAPNRWRGREFYLICAGTFPILLALAARAGRLRWPATASAALFMLSSLILGWVLQTIPATPKLAPIENPLTHLVVAPFPILLVVPAALFDLLHRRVGDGRDWRLAGALGLGFVLALLAVSWPVSAFLISPAAQNPVFLGGQWDYSSSPGAYRYEFWGNLSGVSTGSTPWLAVKSLAFAALLAMVSSRLGLTLGGWMRRVRR